MLIQAVPKMIEDGCPAERKLEPSAEHVEGKFSDEPGPSMEPIVRQGRESLIVDSYDAQNRGDIEFSNPFQSTFSTTPFHSEARPAAIVHSPGIMNLLTLLLLLTLQVVKLWNCCIQWLRILEWKGTRSLWMCNLCFLMRVRDIYAYRVSYNFWIIFWNTCSYMSIQTCLCFDLFDVNWWNYLNAVVSMEFISNNSYVFLLS